MKKRLALILGGSAALLLLFAAPTFADAGPHQRATSNNPISRGSCASCHRAHTAQAPKLLTDAEPGLCYECHGETGQGGELNVEGGVDFGHWDTSTPPKWIGDAYTPGDKTNTGFAALRGGGFKYAALGNAVSGQSLPAIGGQPNDPEVLGPIANGSIGVLSGRGSSTSAHSVDPNTPVTMWGNGTWNSTDKSVKLTCSSCHDPHGNGTFRILRGIPTGSGATSSVVIADEATKTYTTTNYWNVAAAGSAEFVQKISDWCSTCHTRYLADNLDSKNPSPDSVFKYRHQTDATVAYAPTCIQCHVSHGSNEVMTPLRSAATVTYPDGSPPDPMGNSRLLRAGDRKVCQMCHLR